MAMRETTKSLRAYLMFIGVVGSLIQLLGLLSDESDWLGRLLFGWLGAYRRLLLRRSSTSVAA